ncbi:MAG: toll/interleukin-1 receptor domain-containing protein, partial [Thermodesulfovibrionales bacterium]|nr:toll/interleukin-1 receptor domain-containing protein [Thermodesulfovibrionales bacterium]
MQCSSCNSLMTKGRRFWFCEECGNKVEISKETITTPKRLKIFLSYGHDKNEPLVMKIKHDIEALGHDVWIDKSEIKFTDDWRLAISEGIMSSDWFFSFLSKHSTRDPGVCLDEIGVAISVKGANLATILVESEKEVKPPTTISHIQWLDMHDWSEKGGFDSKEFKEWYEEKFTEIRKVLESETTQRFAGEIEKLKQLLLPIPIDAFTASLLKQGFTGRQWLFEEIRQWAEDINSERAIILTGEPGVGKTAFMAWLSHFNKANVLASFFIRNKQPQYSDTLRIIKTLAFQIATRLPDYRKFLLKLPEINDLRAKNEHELFTYLITEPLHICIDGGRQTGLILIDALDEADDSGKSISNLLVKYIPELPKWVKLLATTRPEPKIMPILSGLHPRKIDSGDERNRRDIFIYLKDRLKSKDPSDETITAIVKKSEGIFLYARYVADEVLSNNLSLDRIDEFPLGLGGIYSQYFNRQFPDIES